MEDKKLEKKNSNNINDKEQNSIQKVEDQLKLYEEMKKIRKDNLDDYKKYDTSKYIINKK
jgi:hypothetical protein